MIGEPAGLAEVLDRLPSTRGRPRTVEDLGGLSNRSFRVRTDQQTLLVRLPARGPGVLACDREAELVNARRAAASGAGPAVVDALPDEGVLVVAWVEGRTYGPADLRDEAVLSQVAAACRRLHLGERFVGDFDLVTVQRRYLDAVRTRGIRLPTGYLDLVPETERLAAAMAASSRGSVACHNDLWAANLVDDGDRVWLVDFEFAANNDADFDLGSIWAESGLDEQQLITLVQAYAEAPEDPRVARARVWGLLSAHVWMLWTAIQDASSPLPPDYRSWRVERYEWASVGLRGPGLARLLERATGT